MSFADKIVLYKILSEKTTVLLVVVYCFVLLFFCSQMSPLYPLNGAPDVNTYFNIGKLVFEGRTLYTEAFDHKGPLIFFIYGFAWLLSSDSFTGLFFIEFFAWSVMLLAIYFMARLYLNKSFSFLATIAFPLILLKHTLTGGTAEEFIVVLASVSLYFFIRYFKQPESVKHNTKYMLVHGIMVAGALLIKINLTIFWIFPLLLIFLRLLYYREFKNFLRNIFALFIGIFTLSLPIVVYFCWNNALAEAFDVYIVLNSRYASVPPGLQDIISLIIAHVLGLINDAPVGILLSTIGVFLFPLLFLKNKTGKLAIILGAASSYLLITFTYVFLPYYCLPLFIFSALGIIAICSFLQKFVSKSCTKVLLPVLTCLLLIYGISIKSFFYFSKQELWGRERENNVIYQFAKIVQKEKEPTLLTLGNDFGNAIFTKCNIIPNVKYFISPNLNYKQYPEMRDEQEEYIKYKTVRFVIVTNEIHNNSFYFNNLPAFHANYALLDSCIDYSNPYPYAPQGFKVYYLYRSK
ncbi:glycosyltransferase family 39 protein [Viscerimonas tarda]